MFSESVSRHWVVAVLAVLASSAALVHADPQDEIRATIQKIADAPNYSWSATWVGNSGSDTLEGKLRKDGLIYLHGIRPSAELFVYIQGDKIAVKGPEGTWQTIDEDQDSRDGVEKVRRRPAD